MNVYGLCVHLAATPWYINRKSLSEARGALVGVLVINDGYGDGEVG